jgi:hypothetical protein
MKFIKLFESWHEEYSYNFSDRGFELQSSVDTKNTNKLVSGKYKGKYILTDLNDDFIEMVLRMSDYYEILRTKTYFNSTTGNASFEVEVSDKISVDKFIEIDTNDGKIKWFPIKVIFISTGGSRFYGNDPMIRFSGRLESGSSKSLSIIKKGVLTFKNQQEFIKKNNKLEFHLEGLVSKKPKIDNENLLSLFNMIDEGHVENDYIDKYEEIKNIIISNERTNP